MYTGGLWGHVLDTVHWRAVGDKIMYTGGLWGYVLDIVHWGAVGDKTGGAVGIR